MIKKIICYFIQFTFKPKTAISGIIQDRLGLWIGFCLVLGYSLAYSLTVLIFYLLGHQPVNTPLLTIPLDKWYLFQAIYTVPVYMGAFLAYTSLCYLLSKLLGGKGNFDNTLATQAFALHIPGVILMWIPETILGPYALITKTQWVFPDWIEVLRLFIIQFVWIFILSIIALHKVHSINWLKGLVVTTISLIPFGIVIAVFIR